MKSSPKAMNLNRSRVIKIVKSVPIYGDFHVPSGNFVIILQIPLVKIGELVKLCIFKTFLFEFDDTKVNFQESFTNSHTYPIGAVQVFTIWVKICPMKLKKYTIGIGVYKTLDPKLPMKPSGFKTKSEVSMFLTSLLVEVIQSIVNCKRW